MADLEEERKMNDFQLLIDSLFTWAGSVWSLISGNWFTSFVWLSPLIISFLTLIFGLFKKKDE